MENKSHLTATSRYALSVPVRYLQILGHLKGKMLDYGCGRGFDCDTLECDSYDPYYRPEKPNDQYDTIFCVYVLNVIPEESERQEVLDKVQSLLLKDGEAYFAVRLGMKQGWTKKGTYQESVELELPVIKKTSTYRIHRMERTCTEK